MNRFRFRLENVLRLRGIDEEKKKRKFGTAMRNLNREEKELGKMGNSLNGHEEFMEECCQGNVSAKELQNNFNYARALDDRIDDQQNNVDEKKEIVEDKRAELVESTKRKKVLERLKERYREDHKQAAIKEEQNLIDELTSMRHKRFKK